MARGPPKDMAGRQLVRDTYGKGPYTDDEMAHLLGMPRTTVAYYRRTQGLPAISRCSMCPSVIPNRHKFCALHRAWSKTATEKEAYMTAKAIGTELLQIGRHNPRRFDQLTKQMRTDLGEDTFNKRFQWVEEAFAKERQSIRGRNRNSRRVVAEDEPLIPFIPHNANPILGHPAEFQNDTNDGPMEMDPNVGGHAESEDNHDEPSPPATPVPAPQAPTPPAPRAPRAPGLFILRHKLASGATKQD